MPSQVAVSTYFIFSSCCDPFWDVGLVFFETLLEATWDDCHWLVIRLSPVSYGFNSSLFVFSLVPFIYRHKWLPFKGVIFSIRTPEICPLSLAIWVT